MLPGTAGRAEQIASFTSVTREEAGVDHVEVVGFVGPAVGVEHGCGWIRAEPNGPGLVRAVGVAGRSPMTGEDCGDGKPESAGT